MKKLISISLFALMYLFTACSPSGYIPSPNGDIAEISLPGYRIVKGELLAVTDTMIYVVKDNNILGIRNNIMNDMNFNKYSDNSWVIAVLLGEVLPAVVLTSLVASHEGDAGLTLAITLIPAAISATLFALSSPKTNYDDLQNKSEIYELKKFARYPGGLTESQFKELLNFYGQDSCIYLK